MFNSISWELFFTAVLSLTSAYYFITILLLYHNEITHWWKSRNDKPIESTLAQSVADSTDVMGGVDQTVKTTVLAKASIPSNDTIETDVLIGTVSDLLQEIKALIQLTTENNWGKENCESLFRALLIRYPSLKNTSHQQSVSTYIADASSDEFPFELSAGEIMTWWE